MSDATLPPFRPSSSAESQSTQLSDSNTSGSEDIFPFLVHSQSSVTSGEPPEVDNAKLARQKRRRTSAEDQAALEAEYKQNPKPDKLARLEIVKKVSLGEKEVQIWFQNRRQNTRRKSRPLLPHEIAAFGLGGMAALSSVSSSNCASGGAQNTNEMLSSSQDENPVSSQDTTHPPKQELVKYLHGATISPPSTKSCLLTRAGLESLPVTPQKIPSNLQLPPTSLATESPILPQLKERYEQLPHKVGYLSNRRNTITSSTSTPGSPQARNLATPTIGLTSRPLSSPERLETAVSTTPVQEVRLSLSLDGKAELIPSDVSPPQSQLPRLPPSASTNPRRQGGLQRSRSALPFGPLPQKLSSNAPFVPRMLTGRSRDARTWEFCCDTDARDELTKQAENESNGSAIAAISLLRSTSASALKPNVNKRNAPTQKHETSKRGKRPKLGRSSSSLAILQSTGKPLPRSPSGDSDKENWVPHGESGNPGRRPLPAAQPQKEGRRRILEEPRTGSKLESGLARSKISRGQSKSAVVEIFEDKENKVKVDQEVEKFMEGGLSPSKKGDLDCVQGLLSLSQGNWR